MGRVDRSWWAQQPLTGLQTSEEPLDLWLSSPRSSPGLFLMQAVHTLLSCPSPGHSKDSNWSQVVVGGCSFSRLGPTHRLSDHGVGFLDFCLALPCPGLPREYGGERVWSECRGRQRTRATFVLFVRQWVDYKFLKSFSKTQTANAQVLQPSLSEAARHRWKCPPTSWKTGFQLKLLPVPPVSVGTQPGRPLHDFTEETHKLMTVTLFHTDYQQLPFYL